jgi:hypothetical protein
MRRYFHTQTGFQAVQSVKGLPSKSKNVIFFFTKLTVALTTSGVFLYILSAFFDTASDTPIDEMIYKEYPVHDCSIQNLQFTQLKADYTIGQAQVWLLRT